MHKLFNSLAFFISISFIFSFEKWKMTKNSRDLTASQVSAGKFSPRIRSNFQNKQIFIDFVSVTWFHTWCLMPHASRHMPISQSIYAEKHGRFSWNFRINLIKNESDKSHVPYLLSNENPVSLLFTVSEKQKILRKIDIEIDS